MSFITDALFGGGAADAATESAEIQSDAALAGLAATEAATEQGLGFLQPFSGVGQQGLSQASFLTDPNAQFDFIKNNPLFKLALDNANTGTQNLAAAGGRLSAGDTLQQLSNNVLLSASPLIADQKKSIGDLLNFGSGIATTQANTAINQGTNAANLITDAGAANAAGVVGAANAQSAGVNNLLTTGLNLLSGGIFSDARLKENKVKIGEENGFNIYKWTWNKFANALGLYGDGQGFMAQEVMLKNPEAITMKNGYFAVYYDRIK